MEPQLRDHVAVTDSDIADIDAFLSRHTLDTELGDGTPIRIRPIGPDDKAALAAGLRELSPQSQYLRFLQLRSEFTERELAYLTELDYVDHFAWAALATGEPGVPGVGVARYVRDHERPDTAEAAVVVIDRFHNRGVGGLLLRALAETAVRNGIHHLRGYVASENRRVLDSLRERGGVIGQAAGGLVPVEFPLPAPDHNSIAYRALRAAAAGRAEFQPPPDVPARP